MYMTSSGLELQPMTPDSANISNYSCRQASIPSQLPAISVSPFEPAYTPGYVNAPFATPYAVPFSAPELSRQFAVAGPLRLASSQPSNLRATDNLSSSMVTIDGLDKGMGCTVMKGSEAKVTVDLTGTNPFSFVN